MESNPTFPCRLRALLRHSKMRKWRAIAVSNTISFALLCVQLLNIGTPTSLAAKAGLLHAPTRLRTKLPPGHGGRKSSIENRRMPAVVADWDVSVGELEERVRGLVKLIDDYGFLAECHLTDFYTDNLWKTLPADWRTTFEALSAVDTLQFISLSSDPSAQLRLLQSFSQVPPSLQHFLEQLDHLPLPRTPPQAPTTTAAASDADDAWLGFKVGEGLTRGMTPKKLHEVSQYCP